MGKGTCLTESCATSALWPYVSAVHLRDGNWGVNRRLLIIENQNGIFKMIFKVTFIESSKIYWIVWFHLQYFLSVKEVNILPLVFQLFVKPLHI